VLGLDFLGLDFFPLVVPGSLPLPGLVLGYVGIGPGQEFIPYFLALLALVGTALSAVIRWPFAVLARLLGRFKRGQASERARMPVTASVPGSAEEGPTRSPGNDDGGSRP
jgi:hypothetical protein